MGLEGTLQKKQSVSGDLKIKDYKYGVDGFSPIAKVEETSEGAKITIEDKNGKTEVVIKNKNTQTRIGEAKLMASGWIGNASPYSQIVNIEGVTENSQVDLTPSVEQLAVFYDKDLAFVTENEDGVVTVYAIGQKPQNDYTIQVTITEVAYE